MCKSEARNYRALAAECERQAELAFAEPHFRDMQRRLAKSYAAIADAEDWLDGRSAGEQVVEPHTVQEAAREAA